MRRHRQEVHIIKPPSLLTEVFTTTKLQKTVPILTITSMRCRMPHQRRNRLLGKFLMQNAKIALFRARTDSNSIYSVALKQLSIVRSGVQQALSLSRNDSTMSANSRESSRKDNKNTQASR
jgi:hypothetical protein